tara:strand:- start:290 stop:541 length:252 start_codon:yes stop_codon:yes gene_type:complete
MTRPTPVGNVRALIDESVMVAANRLHCLDQRVQLRHIGVWQLADDPLTEPQLANEPSATQTDSQMRRNRQALLELQLAIQQIA